MALFGNTSKEGNPTPVNTVSTPSYETPNPYTTGANTLNVIGKGTTITGDIDTSNDIRWRSLGSGLVDHDSFLCMAIVEQMSFIKFIILEIEI